ncbi:MAG: cupin domain-containing protein [Gammaproteobacteria bacterium]|nr:cupin domain-containing protein [Gammaproteobacteria bacterium]
MNTNIVEWEQKLSNANIDKTVGIQIATLLETEGRGTYITVIPPGSSVKPHYHKDGDEEYHIISGEGEIRLMPAEGDFQLEKKQVKAKNSFIITPNTIHQLFNNGSEPLTLIFSCPLTHLKEDRFVVEDFANN